MHYSVTTINRLFGCEERDVIINAMELQRERRVWKMYSSSSLLMYWTIGFTLQGKVEPIGELRSMCV